MLFNKTHSKNLIQMLRLEVYITTLCFIVFLAPHSVHSQQTAENCLPSSPNTGTPEEDYSAGGTRENHQLVTVCGENSQQISFLLGKNNRDFTLHAYPIFWFYIPCTVRKVAHLEFRLTEVATGKKIYDRSIEISEKASLVGLPIPQDPRYALSPNLNYSWSLNVECTESNKNTAVKLEGWVSRLPLKPDLQNQLAASTEEEKHKIYLQEDLYYDALNDLALRRIAEPNNPQLEIAWNQLLTELGWRHIAQHPTVEPYILDQQISRNSQK